MTAYTIRCCMHAPVPVHTEQFTTTICGSQLVYVFSALMPCLLLDASIFWLLFRFSCSCLCLCGRLASRLDEYSRLCGGRSALGWYGGGHNGTMNYVHWLSHRSAEQAVGVSKCGPNQTQTHSCAQGGKLLGEDGQQPFCAQLMTGSSETLRLIDCLLSTLLCDQVKCISLQTSHSPPPLPPLHSNKEEMYSKCKHRKA